MYVCIYIYIYIHVNVYNIQTGVACAFAVTSQSLVKGSARWSDRRG